MQPNNRQQGKSTSLFNPLPLKNESTVPPGRRRASKPKVRSGCLTCKRRHVKCDEAKPGCLRCSKAELVCSGYMSDEPPETRKPPSPPRQTRLLLPRLESQARIIEQQQPQAQLALQPPTHWGTPPPALSPAPSVPFFQSPMTPVDAQYFDLFQNHLIHDLLGLTVSNFWSRTVLRESMRDACIRHSMLAIGALAQGLYLGPDALPTDVHLRRLPASAALKKVGNVRNDDHRAAVSHHTKAVSMFRERITELGGRDETGGLGTSSRSILIATLLFVAYEHLQGNTEAAEQLVTRGLVLLRDSMHLFRSDEDGHLLFSNTAQDDDMTEVKLLLPRLGVTSNFSVFCSDFYYSRLERSFDAGGSGITPGGTMASFSQSQAREAPLHFLPCLPSSFPGPDSALPDPAILSTERVVQLWTDTCTRTLLWIGRYARFNISRDPAGVAPYNIADAEAQQMQWLRQLLWWRSLLISLVERAEKDRQTGPGNEGQLYSLQLAYMQNLLCFVCASCCLDPSHVVADQYEQLVSEVVDRCWILCEGQANGEICQGGVGIRFTFDVGVIPALSTAAAYCRNREVRRKAIVVLKKLRWWREASWDAHAHAIGLEGLVELEERGGIWVRDNQHQGPDMNARSLGTGLDGGLSGSGSGAWGSWFIPSTSRYVWTSASWDIERHKMLAEYTRVLPDEQRRPVVVRKELDIVDEKVYHVGGQSFDGMPGSSSSMMT